MAAKFRNKFARSVFFIKPRNIKTANWSPGSGNGALKRQFLETSFQNGAGEMFVQIRTSQGQYKVNIATVVDALGNQPFGYVEYWETLVLNIQNHVSTKSCDFKNHANVL